MTIIKPSKLKLNIYALISIFALLLLVSFYIYEYNYSVILRRGIKILEKELVTIQNQDVDLKNRLYSLIDPKNLEKIAQEKGLITEKRPSYLKISENAAPVILVSQNIGY